MISMHFNLLGKISILDKTMPGAFELTDNQHNIFYGKEAEGGNAAIKRFSDHVASGRSVAFSDTNLNIDLPLQNCINAVLNCSYSDSLKRMYFFSKSIELLVLQAESFDRAGNKKKLYVKKDYDRERILYARDYLLQHMECPPSLTELSRKVGRE